MAEDLGKRDVEKRWSDRDTFRGAAVYTLAVVGVALTVMAVSLVWGLSNRDECAEASTAVCSNPERYILALGPTVILLLGGLGAFVHTYRLWREGGTWPVWHGAGWVLFVAMLVYLGMSASVLATG
jgi:hypothetical protein